VRYHMRFWDDADYVLFADPARRGYYAVWQDMESHGKFFPTKSNILMVTLVQQDSRRVELQSKADTIAELQAALKRMYGPHIPEPLDILIPKWQSNEFFRGSWSNIAIGTTTKDFDSMQRPVGNLYFAGEATDADYNGFVLGGYHSGEAVGKRILRDMLKDKHMRGLRMSSLEVDGDYPAPAFRYSFTPGAQLLASLAAVAISGLSSFACCFVVCPSPRVLGARVKQRGSLGTPMLPEFRQSCDQLKT